MAGRFRRRDYLSRAVYGTFSMNVLEIRYIHVQDGKAYKHDFSDGVRMVAEADGSIRLVHPTKRLWEEYE